VNFEHEELKAEDLQVHVGGEKLDDVDSGSLDRGKFRVENDNRLTLRLPPLPDGIESGDPVPIRVLINGVESPPRWIKAP
jgi:hypothetical protein